VINKGCKLLRENQRKLVVGHTWLCQKASPYNARCWCHLELLGATRHPKHWQKWWFCVPLVWPHFFTFLWLDKAFVASPIKCFETHFLNPMQKPLLSWGERAAHRLQTLDMSSGVRLNPSYRVHICIMSVTDPDGFSRCLSPWRPMLLLCISHYFNNWMRIQPCWFPNGSSNHQAFGASNQAGHLRQRILRPKDVALGYPGLVLPKAATACWTTA